MKIPATGSPPRASRRMLPTTLAARQRRRHSSHHEPGKHPALARIGAAGAARADAVGASAQPSAARRLHAGPAGSCARRLDGAQRRSLQLGQGTGLCAGLDRRRAAARPAALPAAQARPLHASVGCAQVLVPVSPDRRDLRASAGVVPFDFSHRVRERCGGAFLHAAGRCQRRDRPLHLRQDPPRTLWQPRLAQGYGTVTGT